jgi:hypothetical protein
MNYTHTHTHTQIVWKVVTVGTVVLNWPSFFLGRGFRTFPAAFSGAFPGPLGELCLWKRPSKKCRAVSFCCTERGPLEVGFKVMLWRVFTCSRRSTVLTEGFKVLSQ